MNSVYTGDSASLLHHVAAVVQGVLQCAPEVALLVALWGLVAGLCGLAGVGLWVGRRWRRRAVREAQWEEGRW